MISTTALTALNTQFNGIVQNVFRTATPIYPQVATETRSTTSKSVYGFIDQFPAMKEWLGARTLEELQAKDIEVKNRDFEDTIFCMENDYDDDNLGLWKTNAELLSRAAVYHPDVLVFEQFVNSFSENSYDGKVFFAADHAWKDGTYSNKFELALDWDNFGEMRTKLSQNLGGGETPLYFGPLSLTLLCGPLNETKAEKVLTADYNQLMETNIFKNKAKLVVSQLITDYKWGLFIDNLPIKPWLLQRRQDKRLRNPQDFLNRLTEEKKLVWGIDYRAAAGKLLWQLAVGSDPGA